MKKIVVGFRFTLYCDNKVSRLKEFIFRDSHFLGYAYSSSFQAFFVFDDSEDYESYIQDLAFKLSLGARKAASCHIDSLFCFSDKFNIVFNIQGIQYSFDKDTTLYTGTND